MTDLFLNWCNNAGGHVGRINFFSEFLKQKLPGQKVEIEPIQREQNFHGLVFKEEAQAPVEYWKVTVSHQDLIFPKPVNSKKFAELEPIFHSNGSVTPERVKNIVPAHIDRDGYAYVLRTHGRIG